MTSSVPAFVGKLQKAPETLKKGRKGALLAAAQAGRITMVHAPGAANTVGGKKIDVRTKSIGDDAISLKWGPPGWVRILNDRTQPHFIARRTGRGKKSLGHLRTQNLEGGVGGSKSIRGGTFFLRALAGQQIGSGMVRGAIGLPGIGPRAWAFHPGTKGKHFVEKGKAAAVPIISRAYAAETHRNLAKLFG